MPTLIYNIIEVMFKPDERMEIATVEGQHFHFVCKADRVNSRGMFVFTQGKKWVIWDLRKQALNRNKIFGPANFWVSIFCYLLQLSFPPYLFNFFFSCFSSYVVHCNAVVPKKIGCTDESVEICLHVKFLLSGLTL